MNSKGSSVRKQADRKNVVEKIKEAAIAYKEHLVGRTFMYVFDNRYIEVLYKAANFKHLTGVDSNLSAREFYRSSVRKQLQASQIGFSNRHPFELCCRKLQHLKEVVNLAIAESFMLEEITTQTRSYKFGTTDLKFTLCLNKEHDEEGNEKGHCYIVESLRDEDCFEKSANVYSVSHIFVKRNDVEKYDQLLFMDKNAGDLPGDILNLLDSPTQDERFYYSLTTHGPSHTC